MADVRRRPLGGGVSVELSGCECSSFISRHSYRRPVTRINYTTASLSWTAVTPLAEIPVINAKNLGNDVRCQLLFWLVFYVVNRQVGINSQEENILDTYINMHILFAQNDMAYKNSA